MWIVLFPPFFNYIVLKTKLKISYWVRVLIVIILVFITPNFSGNDVNLINDRYYSSTENQMDWDRVTTAAIDANQILNFSFPYNGWSRATFFIRNKAWKDDALLQVTKGQFKRNTDKNVIRIKFDDLDPEVYTISFPSDGSSDAIFISDIDKIKNSINNSEKMLIEAEFYQDGLRVMEFNVWGLRF